MTGDDLRKMVSAARPLIEQWLELSDEFAAFRTAAREKEIDWSAVKALLKASIQDSADNGGRVAKILEKAGCASAYADMLGFGSAAKIEKNISRKQRPHPSAAALGDGTPAVSPYSAAVGTESAAVPPIAAVSISSSVQTSPSPLLVTKPGEGPFAPDATLDFPECLKRDASNRAAFMGAKS